MGAYIFIGLLCGVIAAMIGSRKGEAFVGFVVGFLLGPFGILIELFSKGKRTLCPFCKELVNCSATICKHCRSKLTTEKCAI